MVASPDPGASSFLPPIPPEPHEYTSIIHSIQRRSVDRASTSSGEGSPSTPTWRRPAEVHDLEADLRLSAQVGVALLQEKGELEAKLRSSESANQKLLDRLTSSVKESSQLQRRLEEAVGNLEQAEGNNRALLVALEEDRKKMSRMTAETARLSAAATQLKAATRDHDDTRQELAAEVKRASAAETRVKKQGERMNEMEVQLKRAIEDLEEMRQDKVLRSRKSHDALAKVRAKFNADLAGLGGSGLLLSESPEAGELLKLVESLISENEMLRSESLELHEMLDVSRDEQSGMRSEMENREAFAEEGDELLRPLDRLSSTPTLASEVVLSPSASHSFSDFEGNGSTNLLASPASTNPTSFARSWAPSFSAASSRPRGFDRTVSSRSVSPAMSPSLEEPTRHPHFQHYYQFAEGRTPLASVMQVPKQRGASQGALAGGKVPIGRGHNRRSMSVDVSSQPHRRNSSILSAPVSPMIPDSPTTQAASIISTEDGDAIRPRRHHRPLSLSLGPSLFPLVPEDAQTPISSRHHSRQSIATSFDNSLSSLPSGLSLSSPEKKATRLSRGIETPVHVTVDSSTQTTPPATPSSSHQHGSSSPRRPRQSTPDYRGLSAGGTSYFATPPASTSDLSERDGEKALLEFGLAPGSFDARTAVLGTLIEHAGKLLARIQAADIASQEKRLKKQNLPGDVRHLATANMKDLLNDIEGLRTHFRRVLEQERTASAREALSGHSEVPESLVIRRDFVALVKLFRDLLHETSRLRSLVNRVELDPTLASTLRELDDPLADPSERTPKPPATTPGLLAPFSRLFSGAISSEPEAVTTKGALPARPGIRPIAKLSGSSAVTSATVNVEFGSGAVRRAVASAPNEDGGQDVSGSTSLSSPVQQHNLARKKSETQVRRDLSSIFAGGLPPPRSPSEPWVVVTPTLPTPARSRLLPSSNAFGRLLAAYKPAMSSTTNAVLDSLPHAPPPAADEYQPTLLERQLRPRGLSDSSIRSTFVQHANPHHRLISPATLALSAEASSSVSVTAVAIPSSSDVKAHSHLADLSSSVSGSLSRKQSIARLRSKPSSLVSRVVSSSSGSTKVSDDIPPVPPLPMSISPASQTSHVPSVSNSVVEHPGSLFGTVSNWASRAATFSTLAGGHAESEDGSERGRSTPAGGQERSGDRSKSVVREGPGVGSFAERSGRYMG